MTKKTLLLAAAAAILTMGAGCASLSTTPPVTQPVTVPTASVPDSSLTPSTSPVAVAPTPSSDGTRALAAAETNATWKLYSNEALGYTVNTPTKGSYAPMWEMKYVDQSDPHIISGCYYTYIDLLDSEVVSDNVVVLDGTKFCHTKSENDKLGSKFVIDDYATVLGKKIVVIEFTKVTTNDSVFVASDYQTTLDGIVGTFQMNTTPPSTTITNN